MFDAYLVDVVEPEGGQKPLYNTYIHSSEEKIPKRITSFTETSSLTCVFFCFLISRIQAE